LRQELRELDLLPRVVSSLSIRLEAALQRLAYCAMPASDRFALPSIFTSNSAKAR
jgi:hypothetical protein